MRRIVVTMGDPAGVGPFITVKALSKISLTKKKVTLVGDRSVLARYDEFKSIEKHIELIDLKNASKIIASKPSKESGEASYQYLKKSVEIIKEDSNCSLVTAPVSKEFVSQAAGAFVGHTEFLAQQFNAPDVVMMMVGKSMKVVLLTRHVFIRDISDSLSAEDISRTVKTVGKALKERFKIREPKMAFCSVNPHAGIETFLENEDLLILKAIEPFIDEYKLFGPYPSDTLFVNSQAYDVIFAAYHDQAMIPFKMREFSSGVNVSLGLPVLRTSPAHGTAFEIADKTDLVDHRSMLAAIRLALK